MKIAVIGCGVMGGALARHFAKSHAVTLCDHSLSRAQALAEELKASFTGEVAEAVLCADVILLAVKPKDLESVAKVAGQSLAQGQLLMSVLTGSSVARLQSHFPLAEVVRIMPSLALSCGEGVIGLVEDGLSDRIREKVDSLLEGLGLLKWVPESQIEALTALAGSGPAFIYVMIEAVIEAGIAMGFGADTAKELAMQTITGAVELLKGSGKHPAELRWQISSPGGTTIAGLNEMEAQGVRSGIIKTFLSTYEKANTPL